MAEVGVGGGRDPFSLALKLAAADKGSLATFGFWLPAIN